MNEICPDGTCTMQSPMPTSADQTYADCQGLAPQMIWYNQTGAVWASGEMPSTTYNHVAPPNGRSCAIMNGGHHDGTLVGRRHGSSLVHASAAFQPTRVA